MKFRFTTGLLCCQISGVLGMMERCRKKRGSHSFSLSIRVHNEPHRAPIPSFASPGATYSAFIAQSRPVLRPFDRSISRRPARAVHRPTSLLSTEPIDHKSGIGVVRVHLPLHRSVHPPSPSVCFRLRRTPPSPSPASKLQI